MPTKRSVRFKARPGKAPNDLVVLPIQWRPKTPQPSKNRLNEISETTETLNITESIAFTSSPPLFEQAIKYSSNADPTVNPNTPTRQPTRPSLEETNLLNSITHAIFTPSISLSTFFSPLSLPDTHLPEAISLLRYLYGVERKRQANRDQSLPTPEELPPSSPPPTTTQEARHYLSALGKSIREVAERNDVDVAGGRKERTKPRPEVGEDGEYMWYECASCEGYISDVRFICCEEHCAAKRKMNWCSKECYERRRGMEHEGCGGRVVAVKHVVFVEKP